MFRILMVEDEALLALPLEDFLNDQGYQVAWAANAVAALQLLANSAPPFAALLTDIRLGVGHDGWFVAMHARSLDHNMPVVYMSADSAANWQEQGVAGSAMLSKPFSLELLGSTLRGALGTPPYASS